MVIKERASKDEVGELYPGLKYDVGQGIPQRLC